MELSKNRYKRLKILKILRRRATQSRANEREEHRH